MIWFDFMSLLIYNIFKYGLWFGNSRIDFLLSRVFRPTTFTPKHQNKNTLPMIETKGNQLPAVGNAKIKTRAEIGDHRQNVP